MRKIVVVGSLNMDVVIETPHLPECGETVSGKKIDLVSGGKGANQAYAAGKLGGNVTMIGAVGNDAAGETLLYNLKSVGVDVTGIRQMENGTTGQAFIAVDDNGDNSIIIIPGANGLVTKELIDEKADIIKESDIVIMQLEIPLDVVEYVKEMAVRERKTVIVDPAPALPDLPDHFWRGIDYAILTGRKLKTREELIGGARVLIEKGVRNVIVTLGSEGCLMVTEDTEAFFCPYQVKAVDTTAAGDSFTAAFALALSQGKTCGEAVDLGQKVSSVAVTRKGAQTSIPTMEEVKKMWDE